MDHTPSVNVTENNFTCDICCKVYEDPIIIDCPCKCIMCKKCLRQHWDNMEIQTNDFKIYEFEVLKKCLNNCLVSVNRCLKAEGLSKVMEDIE